jgi:hypothetical protein
VRQPCAHRDAVPVVLSTGELVAALCPSCDAQLPAKFLSCSHAESIEITSFGESQRSYICNGCGTAYSPDEERLSEDRWIGTTARRADGSPIALMLREGVDEDRARAEFAKALGVPVEDVTIEDGDTAEGICQLANATDGITFRSLMAGDVYSGTITGVLID